MKKISLLVFSVIIIGVVLISYVSCGSGGNMVSIVNDMTKAIDYYVAEIKRVESKEELIKAMNKFSAIMKVASDKGKKLMKDNPNAASEIIKGNIGKKLIASMEKLVRSMMNKNITRFMSDPDVIRASKEMGTAQKF